MPKVRAGRPPANRPQPLPLPLGQFADRRGRRQEFAYTLRRVFRRAGLRPALLALGTAGGLWALLALGPVRAVEAGVAALHARAIDWLVAHSQVEIALGEVSGLRNLERQDILRALSLPRTDSPIRVDTTAAREALVALPWVEDAVVRFRLPDVLSVSITEHRPAAVWQIAGQSWLLNRDGGRIARVRDVAAVGNLPVLVGKGADRAIAEIVLIRGAHPAFADSAARYRRVSDRRWNVVLRNDTVVMLPESGLEQALANLRAPMEESVLFDRDVAAIDLRVPGAIAVRLRGEDLRRLLGRAGRGRPGQGA